METAIEKKHIVATPDTCGGKPRIEGTRIRVQDVYVWHELQGQSPEEIVSNFPHLSLASVHAALVYFFDHRDQIVRDIQEDAAYVDAMKNQLGAAAIHFIRGKGDNGGSVPS
jgi:uncharacterized protein (DUF433 family)